MRLRPMKSNGPRPPLKTVTEIAELLGINNTQLVWALKREGAPQPRMINNQVGNFVAGPGRVWYEPKEVIKWYKENCKADDPEQIRLARNRERNAKYRVKK